MRPAQSFLAVELYWKFVVEISPKNIAGQGCLNHRLVILISACYLIRQDWLSISAVLLYAISSVVFFTAMISI